MPGPGVVAGGGGGATHGTVTGAQPLPLIDGAEQTQPPKQPYSVRVQPSSSGSHQNVQLPPQVGGGGGGGGGITIHGVCATAQAAPEPDGAGQGQPPPQPPRKCQPPSQIHRHGVLQGSLSSPPGGWVEVVWQSQVVDVVLLVVVEQAEGAVSIPVVQKVVVHWPSLVPQNDGYRHRHSGEGGGVVLVVVVVGPPVVVVDDVVLVVVVGSDVVVVVVVRQGQGSAVVVVEVVLDVVVVDVLVVVVPAGVVVVVRAQSLLVSVQ